MFAKVAGQMSECESLKAQCEGYDLVGLASTSPMGDNLSREGVLKLPAYLQGRRRVICYIL
jgi:hypothetical protein